MAKAGDKVIVKTEKEEFEGILMPRPAILDQNVTVVKLESGYNIGIDNKKIKDIKVVKEYKHKEVKKEKLKSKKGLPNVTVLSTGQLSYS